MVQALKYINLLLSAEIFHIICATDTSSTMTKFPSSVYPKMWGTSNIGKPNVPAFHGYPFCHGAAEGC